MVDHIKSTDEGGAPAQTRAPRWMKILLFVSLAFNLAIVGMMAGMLSRGGHPRGFGPDINVGPYAQAFEREDRREINERLRGRRDLRPPRGADAAAARDRFLTLLRAEPFDADAMREMMTEHSALIERRAQAAQEAVVSQLESMTQAERAAYADRLEAMMQHGKGGKPPPPRER